MRNAPTEGGLGDATESQLPGSTCLNQHGLAMGLVPPRKARFEAVSPEKDPDIRAVYACSTTTRRPSADRERQLVESLRLVDPTAADDLVASYGGRAYRLAIGITGNQPDAEEVVQDALWTVVRRIDTFKGDSAFGSWLYRIVANAAYDRLRGRRGRLGDCSLDELSAMVDEHGDSVVDGSRRAQDPTLETDLRIALTAAIETLREGYRTVVVLRDVQGLSTQEISQITGLSVASVKVRAHRARLALRKRLRAYVTGPQPTAARRAPPGILSFASARLHKKSL